LLGDRGLGVDLGPARAVRPVAVGEELPDLVGDDRPAGRIGALPPLEEPPPILADRGGLA
jgi:hypothetical protein